MTHVCVYMIICVCVNASEKTALPALRGRAINEEPVKTQCTGVMMFVGAGVGLAVGVLRWLEQLTVLRKVAPVGSATHDQILGVLRRESW